MRTLCSDVSHSSSRWHVTGPHRHGELHLCEGKQRFYVVRLKQKNKQRAGVCFVLDHLNNVVRGAFQSPSEFNHHPQSD